MASASFFWSPAQAFPGDQESTLLLGGKYALGRSMLIYWSEDINKLVRPLSVCKKISYFNDGKEKNPLLCSFSGSRASNGQKTTKKTDENIGNRICANGSGA